MVVQQLQGPGSEDSPRWHQLRPELAAEGPPAAASSLRDGDGGADEIVSHAGIDSKQARAGSIHTSVYNANQTEAEADDLVKNCNYLLAQVGLNVKNVESFKELTRVRHIALLP
jgi:hypothetical protein